MPSSSSSLAVPGPLVDAAWVQAHLGDPRLRLVDASVGMEFTDGVRSWVNGRAGFEEAHLPGAQFGDLLGELSGPGPDDFVLPDAETFAAAAGHLGLANDSVVVVYDTSSTTWATRVRWLLKHYGHDEVAVLDGGLAAWRAAGGAIEEGPSAEVPRTAFEVAERSGDTVDTAEVRSRYDDADTLVVSALPEKDFTGEKSARPRAGRIPGSISIPAGSLIDPETKRLLPRDQLAVRLGPVLEFEGQAVLHCGAGVSATLPLLALELLGRDDVLLYEESLNVWSDDEANPVVTGPVEDR